MRTLLGAMTPARLAILLGSAIVAFLIVRTALKTDAPAGSVELPAVEITDSGDYVFAWPAFAGAEAYVVQFFDAEQEEIARYGPFTETHFTIAVEVLRGVPRGRRVVWRVVALRDGKEWRASAHGAFETPPAR